MRSTVKILIVALLVVDILLAGLVFGPFEFGRERETLQVVETTAPTHAPTIAPTEVPTMATELVPTETTLPPETEATVPATTEATVPATEGTKNTFTLTFAGDCTLGTTPGTWNAKPGFIKTIGSDLSYPFKRVASYFQEDDFSLVNLEGPLTDGGTAMNGKTSYRGPTEYVAMLTETGIEAVTLANDHIMDYGQDGYESTLSTLGKAEIVYVEKNTATVLKTDSGLTIGLYAVMQNETSVDAITAGVTDLKDKGAELVIVAGHWGIPGNHSYGDTQKKLAHAAIDAGAHIVVGTHPHVLQPIEAYGDGIIYYSLGRFVFGGASVSTDWDTALVQQEVVRNEDGTISLGQCSVVPASLGNKPGVNNFQPTPFPKDQEGYSRVLKKLNLD